MTPSNNAIVATSQAVLQQHAKSFRWAQLFLGPRQRADSAVAYAFCRLVDDTVDEAPNEATARAGLAELEAMLEGQKEPSPLILAYRELGERAHFGLEPARSLLRGAESDLGPVRVADDGELGTYCYRVAGTVGLMMCGILGVTDPRAHRHAVDLGVAMQLTNICRDVREDAELGRVYLPQARLSRHGLTGSDLLQGGMLCEDPARRRALAQVTAELLELADQAYASGEAGLPYLPIRARLAIAVASRVYGGIGRRLRRVRDSDPWPGRVHVPSHLKLALVVQAFGPWARASWANPPLSPEGERSPLPLPAFES